MNHAEFIYTVLLKPAPLKRTANAILRRIIRPTVRRYGAVLALNSDDPVVSGALTLNVYEKAETEFFLSVCRPGLTFLDIGANIGYYTALAQQKMNGSGRIIAFEPDPTNFGFLSKTVELNPFPQIVHKIQAAASDHEGRMVLHVATDNRGDSRLYAHEFARVSVAVNVTRIDRLMEELGPQAVDMVKMDVQGHEYSVIEGMREVILSSPGMILISEFWPHGLASAGYSGERYLNLLIELGFQLFEMGRPLKPIGNVSGFAARYPNREYTNIVGLRGALNDWGLSAS